MCLYQSGTDIPIDKDCSPEQLNYQTTYDIVADTEHSANSEGSHETGDSGRFSHESDEELHLSTGISAAPATSDSFEGNNLRVTTCPVLSASEEPPDQSCPLSLQLPPTGQN